MAILIPFKPVADAMLNHIKDDEPSKIVFFIGSVPFTVKEIQEHILKEDTFAEKLIMQALNVNSNEKFNVLTLEAGIPSDVIDRTVKMFSKE